MHTENTQNIQNTEDKLSSMDETASFSFLCELSSFLHFEGVFLPVYLFMYNIFTYTQRLQKWFVEANIRKWMGDVAMKN